MEKFACCITASRAGLVCHSLFLVAAGTRWGAREKARLIALRAYPEDQGYSGHRAMSIDVRDDPIDPATPGLVVSREYVED